MSKYLVESVKGVPAPTLAAVDPDSSQQPVTKPFAWDGERLLAYFYTPCLVLVLSRDTGKVTFKVIDAETGKLATDANGDTPIFEQPVDDFDPVHTSLPSTLPPIGTTKPQVSILMLARKHLNDAKLDAVLDRANLPAAKWPRGEPDGNRFADILVKILRRPGVWKLLGADLQEGVQGLGVGPVVELQ